MSNSSTVSFRTTVNRDASLSTHELILSSTSMIMHTRLLPTSNRLCMERGRIRLMSKKTLQSTSNRLCRTQRRGARIRVMSKKTLQTTYSENFLSHRWRDFEKNEKNMFVEKLEGRISHSNSEKRFSEIDLNTFYGRFEKKWEYEILQTSTNPLS